MIRAVRRTTAAIAAAALAILGAWVPALAQAPEGSVGIRLLEAPSDRQDDPRARLYIIDHLVPGSSISRRIEVSNGLTEDARIQLYAAGASVDEGTFRFFDGKRQNDVASWTSIDPPAVRVRSDGVAEATVTIDVPADAAGGEHYAVVWAELPPAKTDQGVSSVSRVGIRIYLSVGGGSEPASDFAIESLAGARDAEGNPLVTAQVRNTGGRALDLGGDLRLQDGPGGLSAGPFAAQLGTTLGIGETAPVVVPLDPEIPAGPWTARLALRSGTLERRARATITFPAEFGTSSGPVEAIPDEGRKWLIPFALGLLLLVLAGLLFFLWKRRRRTGAAEGSAPATQRVPTRTAL
jgi:hypothetical protein